MGKSFFYHSGQAMVEYILVLVFASFIGVNLVQSFSEFFRDSFGSLGHSLSINLNVGVCPENCFFAGYKNGFKK